MNKNAEYFILTSVSKENVFENLKANTYVLNWQNQFYRNAFLCSIKNNQIILCYTGGTLGQSSKEYLYIDLVEEKDQIALQGKFILSPSIKLFATVMLCMAALFVLSCLFSDIVVFLFNFIIILIPLLFLYRALPSIFSNEETRETVINFVIFCT